MAPRSSSPVSDSIPPSSPTSEPAGERLRSVELPREKRARSSSTDDEDNLPAPKHRRIRTFEEEITYKGRRFVRIHHLYVDYDHLITEGSLLKQRDPSTLSDVENRTLRCYTSLLLYYPNIKSDERKCEERNQSISKLLSKGCSSARGEDINTLKSALPSWEIVAVPVQKNLRGYNDPVCLKLLAPPNFLLDEPSVVEGIKSLKGPYALTPKHLPSFLYLNGILHRLDIYKGLFRGELLLRAGLCILRGQEASMDGKITKNTGKSVSEKHKIKTITPAFIAYVATLVRFTLTNQTHWNNSGGNGWKYHSFYKQLLNLLEEKMTKANLELITSEWKSRIFGDNMDSDSEDSGDHDANDAFQVPDLRDMLVAQANEDKEREAEARKEAEAEARRQLEAANRAFREVTNASNRR